jgi:hypothetical protein
MKKVFVVSMMAILLTQTAQAAGYTSTIWTNCSDAFGDVKIENGKVTIKNGPEEDIALDGAVLTTVRKVSLQRESKSCTLKSSGREEEVYLNVFSAQQINIEHDAFGSEGQLFNFICSVGMQIDLPEDQLSSCRTEVRPMSSTHQ